METTYCRRACSSLLILFACASLLGQPPAPVPFKRCPVKTINFEQGLMNIAITSAITDERGYTWFSTKTGLQRYNGYVLETITPVAEGDTIHINYPVFFQSNRDHSVLIGYKKGVLSFDPRTNSFHKLVSLPAGTSLHYSLVPVLESGSDLWCLQENRGIIIYHAPGQFTRLFPDAEAGGVDSIFRSDDFFQNNKIVASNDDYIFLRVSPFRILQINVHSRQVKKLDYPAGRIFGLTCNRDRIFIASLEGLTCIRISDGLTLHRFPYSTIVAGAVNYSTLELTSDHHLLVTVDKSLFEFDSACRCQKEITNLNGDLIITTGVAPFIYQDKFRRIWLLTLNDIKRIENVEVPFEHLLYPREKNNFVRSICLDEQEHLLIAGCYNGGIELYDSLGKPLWEKPLITAEVKDVLSIEKIYMDSYLVVTLRNGLYLLDIRNRKIRPLTTGSPLGSPLRIQENSYSNNLQRLDDSTLLISTRSNVYRCVFHRDVLWSATPLLKASQLYRYPVTCFLLTPDNTLWVSTESGVLLRRDAGGNLKSINIPESYSIRCMARDSLRQIWVGTEKGLFIYSPAGNLVRSITKETGLLNDIIYALLPDDSRNNFFASTNLGLSFISASGQVKNFTRELGLQENEFNTQSCARSGSGKLYFGGINGITAFYPGALSGVNDTPFIDISRLVVNDSLYNSYAGAYRGDTILLNHNQNRLQFDIAAIGLLNPNEYQYKYRLHGSEESWQSTHQPTGIRYTLPPGNYQLEITCSPILSLNTVFYRKIAIIVRPPWWQTWWFRTLALVLLVMLIASVALSYNRRKYQQKIKDLQLQSEIQMERERISKELHDNIGSQLSYISSNIEWMLDAPVLLKRDEEINRLTAVNQTAKEMISDLRETIWAIKNESIQLEELADKLKLFIQSQQLLNPQLEIRFTENIGNNLRFSPTEALNIFRICQEAVTNCFRHARATLLQVHVDSGAGGSFCISMEDNGKGFEPGITHKGHYGLENMQGRALELGALLTIDSLSGRGTTIILSRG